MPSADRLQVLTGHRCMPMPRIVSFLDRRERGSGRIQRQLMVLRTKRAMAAFDALCWVCEKKVERTVPNPEMFLIIIRTVCTYIYIYIYIITSSGALRRYKPCNQSSMMVSCCNSNSFFVLFFGISVSLSLSRSLCLSSSYTCLTQTICFQTSSDICQCLSII